MFSHLRPHQCTPATTTVTTVCCVLANSRIADWLPSQHYGSPANHQTGRRAPPDDDSCSPHSNAPNVANIDKMALQQSRSHLPSDDAYTEVNEESVLRCMQSKAGPWTAARIADLLVLRLFNTQQHAKEKIKVLTNLNTKVTFAPMAALCLTCCNT